jgi:hypothetical protein
MSRTDSWVGLSPRACKWLKDQVGDPPQGKEYIKVEGAFYNEFPLMEYEVASDRVFEIIQVEPWASGPHFFTTLRLLTSHGLSPILDLDWTEGEIEEYL